MQKKPGTKSAEIGLPMRYTAPGRGDRLGRPEFEDYRRRRAAHLEAHPDYDRGWHRPTRETALSVWKLIDGTFDARDIAPEEYLRKYPKIEDYERHDLEMQWLQVLTVALDVMVLAGRRRRMASYTAVFDAIARHWSDNYRAVIDARRAYRIQDMRRETAVACRRDLVRLGIRMDTLWNLVAKGEWSSKNGGRNPLYRAERLDFSAYTVKLVEPILDSSDSLDGMDDLETVGERPSLVDEFERLILADPEYRRPDPRPRLLLAADRIPPRSPRGRIAGEQLYNVVPIGDRAKKLLAAQESVVLVFDSTAFVAEYKAMSREATRLRSLGIKTYGVDPAESAHKPMQPGMRKPAPSKRERCLYALPRGERREAALALCEEYDHARGMEANFSGVYTEILRRGLKGDIEIRSRFTRTVNRRFQPLHFWPTAVTTKAQPWELDPDDIDDEDDAAHFDWLGAGVGARARWFRFKLESAADEHGGRWGAYRDMAGVDVSASQSQILSVFLDIRELEQVAASIEPSFKEFLAKKARRSGALRPGYNQDERSHAQLVELCKSTWMRLLYGSTEDTIVKDQRLKPRTYGPGWKSGDAAAQFLAGLPGFDHVAMFLNQCRNLGKAACDENAIAGISFVDPLDDATVRWNPIRRAVVELSSDGSRMPKLNLSLPGHYKTTREFGQADELAAVRRFIPAPVGVRYPVDGAKLGRFLAPAIVHSMDAYLSGLVLKRLFAKRIPALGIHDAWLVPTTIDGRDSGIVLKEVLDDAAKEWFCGLGPFYALFEKYDEVKQYGGDLRKLWIKRRTRKKWPKFAVKPADVRLPDSVFEDP